MSQNSSSRLENELEGFVIQSLVVKKCHHHTSCASFACDQIAPRQFNPELFHAIFPWAFSLLSGGKKSKPDGSIVVRCTETTDWANGEVKEALYSIFTGPRELMGQLINAIKQFLMPIFPSVIEPYHIYFQSTDPKERRHRPFQFNPGKKIYNFFTPPKKESCPAAFNSLYPFILPEILKTRFGEDARRLVAACPDHLTNVKMLFEGPQEKGNQLETRENVGCDSFSGVHIEVLETDGKSLPAFKVGQVFSLKEIVHSFGFSCYSAFHSVYPYWLSILNDAPIRFYTRNPYSAMVQCPSLEGKVEMKIARVCGLIELEVLNMRNPCPLGMQSKTLPREKDWIFCPHSLNTIFPYFQILLHGPSAINELKVFSPVEESRSLFRVFKG